MWEFEVIGKDLPVHPLSAPLPLTVVQNAKILPTVFLQVYWKSVAFKKWRKNDHYCLLLQYNGDTEIQLQVWIFFFKF